MVRPWLRRWVTLVAAGLVTVGLTALPSGASAEAAPAPVIDPGRVCAAAGSADFPDRGTTHAPAIDCLTFYTDHDGAAVIRGLDDGTFGTDRRIDRGQFAALLLRFLTVADPGVADAVADAPGDAGAPFDDVRGTTHASAIGALAGLGVLDGRADGTFGPRESVSRGAAASALARALEVAGVGLADRGRGSFADQGDTHARAIGRLTDLGLVAGVGDDRFATFAELSRGQVATLLARSAQLLDDQDAWAADPTTGRPPADGWVAPRPRATPATTHPPRTLVAVGDSITLASGATREGEGLLDVLPGVPRPARSWSTGTAAGLHSVLQRLQVLEPDAVGTNVAEEGQRMRHAVEQVPRTPAATDLITIQLGGNDLCRPTVGQMTSADDYAAQLRDALELIAAERPTAMVQLSSVPDIYRLWEVLRDDPIAVALWNGAGLFPPVVPCQSLLAEATSDAPADQARRDAVRERSRAYNAAADRECARLVRCRFDEQAVWDATHDLDRFQAQHISTVDFFHPSFAGQRLLAAVAWESGFDWTDGVAPQLDVEVTDDALTVTAAADAGVAGIERRVVAARERRPAWTAVPTEQVAVALDPVGATGRGSEGFEVRAVDVNGNVSTSVVIAPPR